MKPLLPMLVLIAAIGAGQTRADDWPLPGVRAECCDPPACWADRHDVRDARSAITTVDGRTTLLLTDRAVALQLSDRAMHKLDRRLHDDAADRDDGGGPIGDAVRTAVLAGVRELLDHSIEVPMREVADVAYRDGRLDITDRDGEALFGHVTMDDRDVMASFDPHDARAFVRAFARAKSAIR
ncbi:MAG TPA: hypothetical protein VFK69_08450 [Candidatus Eisenbacteria bacterium]|nr:hypothetical protein [Candidatus Eisenbacteria bacterium]